MKLILNADDFGQCEDTFRETVRCFEEGALTSATMMVTMPFAPQAMEYALGHPHFSFGIHLTYVRESESTDERPVCEPQKVSTLVDADGRFKVSGEIRKAALAGKLDIAQISLETAAQIQRALDAGVRVSHVDSHGHLHKFAPFRAALKKVLPQFGIQKVRTVQDVYLRTPWKSPTYWLGKVWRGQIAASHKTTDHLYLPTSAWDDLWPQKLLDKLKQARGSVEVGVHPGTRDPWRLSESKNTVLLAELARQQGIELLTWNDV